MDQVEASAAGVPPPSSKRHRFVSGKTWRWLAAFVMLVASLGAVVWAVTTPMLERADPPFAPVEASAGEQVGILETTNSSGRSCAYYIPAHRDGATLPMAVLIHGTGGRGAHIMGSFRSLAKHRGFVVVAPDSRQSPDGLWTWQVGDEPGEETEDLRHTLACVEEVRTMPGWQLDPSHVLIAGFSGGASLAPYIATNREPFTAYAVLHGGAFPGGLGARKVRGWMSTGRQDNIRAAAPMRQLQAVLARRSANQVRFRLFEGGHGLSNAEKSALVDWWLE